MAFTLVDGTTVHNAGVFDIAIRIFRQSTSLDLLVWCCILVHLSSDLVFGMNWF